MQAVKFVFDNINGSVYRTLAATPVCSLSIFFTWSIKDIYLHLGVVYTVVHIVQISVVVLKKGPFVKQHTRTFCDEKVADDKFMRGEILISDPHRNSELNFS
jgi:hypothetical protein